MKELFFSIFGVIFLAELPDKTALAILIMASRGKPLAIFAGSALAFFIQSVVAVLFGRVLFAIPGEFVRRGSGILFILFAVMMWRQRNAAQESEHLRSSNGREVRNEVETKSFLKSAVGAFLVVFAAEWGDLTQLATATFEAKYNQPFTIFLAATLALWAATALSVVIGHRAGTRINQKLLQTIGAIAFGCVGAYLIARG